MAAWQLANQAGRHAEALPLIEALVTAYPQEPALHFRHARNLRELGRFEEALLALGRLLSLRPQAVPALLQRAELEALLGDFGASEDSLRRAVAVDPRHAEARVRLAAFLLERGEQRQAGYELDQALVLDPSSVEAADLQRRLQAELLRPPAAPATARATPSRESTDSAATGPVRLLIDALPLAAAPAAAAVVPSVEPLAELPAEALQALLDSHWAGLRQDEDRLAATASHVALLLAWEPMPVLQPVSDFGADRRLQGLQALGYRPLAEWRPVVHLPFADPVPARLLISEDGRVLALQAGLPLPRISFLERWWLRLGGRWQRIELLELCSQLGAEQGGLLALILSNNLGGQMPFQDLPPVYLQRYNRRASAKALDALHRGRIESLRKELDGRCLPMEDLAAARSLLQTIHQQRRRGRQRLELLRDEELQRFLGSHYARMAGRVYRQLEALQQGVQDLLAAQASRASELA